MDIVFKYSSRVICPSPDVSAASKIFYNYPANKRVSRRNQPIEVIEHAAANQSKLRITK